MILYCLDDDLIELNMWDINVARTHPEWSFVGFNNVADFKQEIEVQVPQVVVVDLVMPFTNGVEICKWLRQEHPTIHLFVNTALDGDEYKILADRCSATYMSKSTKFTDRIEVIHNGCRS